MLTLCPPGMLHEKSHLKCPIGQTLAKSNEKWTCDLRIYNHCGDVAPQPHSRCSSTSTPPEHALNLSAPSSRSFVLAALRALHLDTGIGFSAVHIEVETAQNALTTPRPFRDDNP